MKKYRVTEDEYLEQQRSYRKHYDPFRPFAPSKGDLSHISTLFTNLVATQNGQDTDDYVVFDGNKVERYCEHKLGLPPGSKVLLLGVGTGRETLIAQSLGYDAVGITLGSRNIDFGHKYLNLSSENHIECLNEALPFEPQTFDAVLGFQIFEHTIAPLLFLLEQGRVLKTGGKILLEWPPAKDFTMDSNPHHQVCFTPGQARGLFRKAGFAEIQLYYDDLTTIPEEDYWRADQNKMLCIQATKPVCHAPYISNSWSLRGK